MKIIGNKLTEAIKSLSSVCSFCFTPMPTWQLCINHRPQFASSTEEDSLRGSWKEKWTRHPKPLAPSVQTAQTGLELTAFRKELRRANRLTKDFLFPFSPEADGFRRLLTQDLTGEELITQN